MQPAPLPQPQLYPTEPVPGYQDSSFDLRAGLEVSALAVKSLPAEVVVEFQRLRSIWRSTSARPSVAAPATESPAPLVDGRHRAR